MKFEIPKPLQQLSGDLGSLGVFLVLRWIVGLKGAIAGTVLFVLAGLVWRIWKQQPISRIYWVVSIMTLGFGTVDLIVDDPFMLKFEASIINLITAGVFAMTLRTKPLAQEIAQSWQEAPIPDRADTRRFFQIMTAGWAVYFAAKAMLYLWAALVLDYTMAMLIRIPVGNGSLLVMILISMQGRKLFAAMKRWGWLPDQADI